MASVYRIRKEECPSGVRYVVDYRDNTGRRSMRRFKRSRDAEAFKKQVEASTYTGLLPPRPVHVTLAQWAEEWFAQKEALCRAGKKPRPSTLNSWRSDVKSLLTALGGYKLHDLTADVVIRYVDHLQDTPIPVGRRSGGQRLRDKSIRNKVGLLSQILCSAKARCIIPLNPVQDLDWKELLGEEERYHRRHRELPLTPEQLVHLLEVARAKYTPKGGQEPTGPYYPFFEMAVWTGLRLGELIGLRWVDVDLTSRPAVLSVQRNSYKGLDGPTKSGAGMREVLLVDRVVRVLQRYQEQSFCADVPPDWSARPLFQTVRGTKLDPDNVRKRHFWPLLKRANLPHVRIQDLRDCFATLLASVVHHRILHIVLGHETLDTTLTYYIKLERLGGLLQTRDGTVLAIRQELEELYRMAHRRYEVALGNQ
jgi:integrase